MGWGLRWVVGVVRVVGSVTETGTCIPYGEVREV